MKLIHLLNSETAPSQIASGAAFGMIVGFTPFLSLHNLIIFLIVCFFRVNLSMFFISMAFFKILGFALDPFFDWFGYILLVDVTQLRPLWIILSSGSIIPYFRFNNTIVMGSLATSLILWIPFFALSVQLIRLYRRTWREQIRASKFMKALKATTFYQWYEKYHDLREKLSPLK